MTISELESAIAARLNRRYARLVGRGTTAFYVALRALALVNGLGEIILPDLICSTVLDAVLLAGFVPIFADVTPDRFTIDPLSVRQKLTAQTRGVLVAHVFGYVIDDMVASSLHGLGVPLIEDAVQGLGGNVGALGDLAFISFDETKMIGGRGGVILTDDSDLWEAIQHVELTPPAELLQPEIHLWNGANERIRNYWPQLVAIRARLIRPFEPSSQNIERIEVGWARLSDNVRARNEKAAWLHDQLAGLPLLLPDIQAGDAIWRYTFTAPNTAIASWILRQLQFGGLSGSSLYPPLSALFAPEPELFSASLERRMINLWVDDATTHHDLQRMIEIIQRAPFAAAMR